MKTAVETKASAPSIETSRVACIAHDTWAAGDCCHQGDLIFVCLGEKPRKLEARANRQIAEGDTRGSRHVVAGGEVYDGNPKELMGLVKLATNDRVVVSRLAYIGPVFEGPCVVEHPEHQHHSFPKDTLTCVLFQRNQSAEDREGRALD